LRIAAERHCQHSLFVVEPEREVRRAGLAQPEVFAPRQLLPVPVQDIVGTGRRSLGKEELAFTQRTKGYCAGWICAFPQHGGIPSSLL
jgi:hypothetical protein